ncbi:hypothetical protein ACH5RR_001394 [Cinchona calisaya]|uniref:UBN2 domain-containing protein n=1 Tax=Cinchona calisaya TaxID=153742 RepID=A0ABD3B3D2_9GENT
MEAHENIDKMYCRFNDIVKDLEGLGKEYSLGEKNRKILNVLPKEWESKSIAIEESKVLNFMPIDSLIDSLTSFELKMKYKVQDEEEARANRSIALKASQNNRCFKFGQVGHFANETPSKKKKGSRKPHFNNFQIHGMIAIRMEKLKKNMRTIKWLLWHLAIMRYPLVVILVMIRVIMMMMMLNNLFLKCMNI